ncbi:MAG: response regulator [Planctomycetota bacterium]
MTIAPNRSRAVRSVLLVDERIDRMQAIERSLISMGLAVQACARFEQAFYVTDAPCDVLLVSAEAAERAGWSQLETLRSGPTGRLAALCYGAPDQLEYFADRARSAGFEPIALDPTDADLLFGDLDAYVAHAAPAVWVLSAQERPGDRTWTSALERAGFRVSWMHGSAVDENARSRPFGIVLRDDAETVGPDWPYEDLRELARDARLVVLGRDSESERRRAWRDLGAAAYVEEPFRPEVLLAQLTAGTERRSQSAHGRDGALGVLWIGVDRSGRVVEWNAAAAEFLAGPGASDVLPLGELNWFDLLCAPAAREQCSEQLDALAAGKVTSAVGEWPVSAHDGEVQWLHWTCRRTADGEDGQAEWVLVGVSDGLWRRWMRGDYGAAVAGADRCGDSLLLLDRSAGEVVFAGSRAQSWWGIGRDELDRSPRWWAAIAKNDHALMRGTLERARRGIAARCGFELESRAGESRLVHARLFMLEPDERGPALVAVLLSEIGEGSVEEPERAADDFSIERLLTAAPIVPFSIDARGHLSLADSDLAAELGLVDDDGRQLELDVRKELPALTERLQEAFDGRGFSVPIDIGERHVELSLWPRFDDQGEVVLLGGVAVDTSDSRRVRDALRVLVESTTAVTGRQFFHKLVHGLVRALGVRHAYLAERADDESDRLRVVSCWAAGEYEEGEIVATGRRPEVDVLSGVVTRLGRADAVVRCTGFPFVGEVAGWIGVPVRDSVGEVVGVLALAHDRALDAAIFDDGLLALLASRAGAELERQRSDALLEKSRGRWRSLVRHMPDIVATVTEDGTVTFANGLFRTGDSIYATCAPEHRSDLERQVRSVFLSGDSRSCEYRYFEVGQPDIWFHARIGSYESEEGESPEVVLISTDVTERKLAEERARVRGEMEMLVTSISTGFINVEPDDVDRQIEIAVAQIGHRSGADRCWFYELAGDALVLRHGWRRGTTTSIEEHITVEHGSMGWLVPLAAAGSEVEVRGGLLCGEFTGELEPEDRRVFAPGVRTLVSVPVMRGREVQGILGFDTARRDLEWDRAVVALFKLLGDVFANVLERQRVEREREVLSLQLRQMQKLEAIGTLAGGVAHDFNNLLMGIGGHAELIGRAADDPGIRREADTIRKAAKQGSKLTRQLLDFARRGETQVVAVDIEHVVTEVAQLLERTLAKNIAVRKDFRSDGAVVLGDPMELHQVVLNLAVNAGDAMEESGGTLTIGTSITEIRADETHLFPGLDPGSYVRLFVADTGSGMTDEQMARIFEPFFTTKPQGKGTGMGLSLVYGIVRSVGGRVDVHSRVGEGTTFEILLPLASGEAATVVEEVEPEVREGTGRVLVVDDEEIVREAAVEMTRALGYEVVGVDGAEAALALLAEDANFDCMLVDLRMPGLDGVQLLERLRDSEVAVPAILCSGGGWEQYLTRIGELELAAFLRKPFQLAELSSVLAQVTTSVEPQRPAGARSGEAGSVPGRG